MQGRFRDGRVRVDMRPVTRPFLNIISNFCWMSSSGTTLLGLQEQTSLGIQARFRVDRLQVLSWFKLGLGLIQYRWFGCSGD